jgi:hypothetical protein
MYRVSNINKNMVFVTLSYCSKEEVKKNITDELNEIPYVYIDLQTMSKTKVETFKIDDNNDIFQKTEEISTLINGNVLRKTYNKLVKNIQKEPYSEYTTIISYKELNKIDKE